MDDPTEQEQVSSSRLPALTLRQLHYFVTLAQLRSFTAAAQALSISQPALTSAIRQAELLLGGRLFDRSSHRLHLTGAGALVLPLAQRLVNRALLSFANMAEAVASGVQTVRIGLIPSVAGLVLARLVELQRVQPTLRFSLQDMANSDLIEAVRDGRVDFGVGVLERRVLEAGLAWVDLLRDDIVVVMRADDPLVRSGPLDWAELSCRPLAVFARGNVADSLLRTAEEMGLELNIAYRMEYTEPIYALVRHRMAMAIMPRLYTEQLHDPQLVALDLRAPHVRRTIALLTMGESDRSPQVAQCREWVATAFAAGPGGGAIRRSHP
ncbi:MAG: LysR family transcriptional regulator [Acidovorax sp.]